jgi:hypothetical protein
MGVLRQPLQQECDNAVDGLGVDDVIIVENEIKPAR